MSFLCSEGGTPHSGVLPRSLPQPLAAPPVFLVFHDLHIFDKYRTAVHRRSLDLGVSDVRGHQIEVVPFLLRLCPLRLASGGSSCLHGAPSVGSFRGICLMGIFLSLLSSLCINWGSSVGGAVSSQRFVYIHVASGILIQFMGRCPI